MNICDENLCTGCMACYNVCPCNAVFEALDDFKSTVYKIDEKSCIKCNRCKNICPANRPATTSEPLKAYATWSKNSDDVAFSSSGGIASVFARQTIGRNGVVFGAAVKDMVAKHIAIDSDEQILLLRGSKYVQSVILYTYRDIKEALVAEKFVLFIGVPCQVAGLKAFLNKDYSNLLTVDLICHGTPPMDYLKSHLDTVCGQGGWETFSFRGKHNYRLVAYKGGIKYNKDKNEDEYFSAFLAGLICREACYSCRYSQINRVSDITLGDFRGLNRQTLNNFYKGKISVVLTNTEKGQKYFDSVKDKLVWEEREVSEAKNKHQHNLSNPSNRHPDRDIFKKEYPNVGFTEAVRKTSINKSIKIKKTIVYKLLRKMKTIITHE